MTKHIGDSFDEFLKEENTEYSEDDIITLLKNADKKILENSGVSYINPPLLVGESKHAELEERLGKDVVQNMTENGEIYWIE